MDPTSLTLRIGPRSFSSEPNDLGWRIELIYENDKDRRDTTEFSGTCESMRDGIVRALRRSDLTIVSDENDKDRRDTTEFSGTCESMRDGMPT